MLLRLLHLASPALPIGGFHFSQGLEYAVEQSWVHDETTAAEWIEGLAECALGRLDLPVLSRILQASSTQDSAAIQRWNAFLVAARETSELRAEDLHMGAALAKVLLEHCVDVGRFEIRNPTYATVFAISGAIRSWHTPSTRR